MSGNIDWRETIVPAQRAIAVFLDYETDTLVIAAQGRCPGETDTIIEIDPMNAIRVAAALLEQAGFVKIHLCREFGNTYVPVPISDTPPKRAPATSPPAGEQSPKRDRTGAQRAARYRAKRKNASSGNAI